MNRIFFGVVVALVLTTGCEKKVPPPTLSGPGIIAWENNTYQSYMDTAREVAIIPAVPVTVAKPVVTWHRSAISTLHARTDQWKDIILAGLAEAQKNVPPTQNNLILALTAVRMVLSVVLREVPQTNEEMIAAYELAYTSSLARDDQWLASH